MTWWQAMPAMTTAAAILLVPGFVFLRGLGARGYLSAGLAPIASSALIGVAGIVGGLLHVRWGIIFFAVVVAVSTALAFLLRRLLSASFPVIPASKSPWYLQWLSVLAGVAAGAAIVATNLISTVKSPEDFAQVYDNVFHLNAIRYILETGDASTLLLGRMVSPGSSIALYPSVWHSIAALVAQLTGADVFVSENALIVVVSALVWPFACITLVRTIIGPRVIPTVVAGVLAAGFWIFPYQLLQFGPLYPNTLSYSLLPLALAVLVGLFRLSRERIWRPVPLAVLLLVSLAGLLLTQPNGFSALMAFSVPMIAGIWFRRLRRSIVVGARPLSIALTVAWGVASAAAFLLVWRLLLLSYNSWKPTRALNDAVGDVFSGSVLNGPATWIATVLAAAGFVTVLARRRGWWMVACFAIAGGLYVIAAYLWPGKLRMFATGSWYQDPYRLAALVPLFTIVLASVGVDGVLSFCRWLSAKAAPGLGAWTQAANRGRLLTAAAIPLSAVLAVTAVTSASSEGLGFVTRKIAISYTYRPGWVVSADELALMSRLDKDVPANAVIAVNPYNGGSLAYAVSGRHVTQYHLTPRPDTDLQLLANGLDTAAPGSKTCQIAKQRGVDYILDFGSFYMLNIPEAKSYPGFDNVPPSSAVQLVDQQGNAKLYRLTSC